MTQFLSNADNTVEISTLYASPTDGIVFPSTPGYYLIKFEVL